MTETDPADPYAATETAFLAEVYRAVTLARCAIESALESPRLCPACEAEREAAEGWRQ